jgi:isopenicillin N synthase-like dioxygenase
LDEWIEFGSSWMSGIPLELLDRVQKQAQKFFDLAKEEKLKVSKAPGSLAGYGHTAVKPMDSQPWTLWPKGDNKEFV